MEEQKSESIEENIIEAAPEVVKPTQSDFVEPEVDFVS